MHHSILLKLFLCVFCFLSIEAEEIPNRWIIKEGAIQQLTLQQEQQLFETLGDKHSSLTKETMESTQDTCIDTVIFDFGGVVVGVGNNPLKQAQFIADTLHISMDSVLANFAKDIVPLGKGEIEEGEFWEKFAQQYGGSVPFDWMNQWRDFYRSCNPLDEKTVSIIQQLHKRGICTPLISDTIPSHAQFNREHGYYDLFDPVILSHEVHIRKPDPSIFHLLLDRIQKTPSRCLFVDDLMQNVEAARKVGMHSIQFKSAEQLEQELMPFLQCVIEII